MTMELEQRSDPLAPSSTRRTLVRAAAWTPALFLAACGAQESAGPARLPAQKERVEFWVPATGALKTTFDSLIGAANASDRQLDVQVTPQGVGIAEDSRAKFTAAVAAGSPPDLIYVDRYLVRSFGALGMIGSLQDRARRSASFKPADFWPYLIKDVTFKDGVWGAPFNTDVRALFWNKGAFADAGLDPERPPATWDAVEVAADRLLKRDASGGIARAGFVPHWGNPPGLYAFFLYLWQSGGEFLSADENKPAFNDAAGLRALEWMVKQVTRAGGAQVLQPLATGFEAGPGRDVFTTGRLAMQYQVSSSKPIYEENVPDVKFGTGALPLPAGGRPMNYAGGFALSIPNAARQADAAWRLSEFLTLKEQQLLWARERAGIPVLKAVASSPEYLGNDPARKIFVDELVRGAKWVPTIPGTVDVLNAFGAEFTAAIAGQKPPRDALNTAATQVQVVLDQNKSYR
jgi:ABC-type glycerol-3-phosphate transport system substrate-binding protein